RFMAPFLGANGFRVYAPDQPSYGWADTDPQFWPLEGIKSYTDFINCFADALCLDKFHISGNSMGCQHTFAYVCAHPDRVISFIGIASGGLSDVTSDLPQTPRSQGKFTPNPAYEGIPFDGNEKSMRDLMAGIIYKAEAVWPELVTMRTKAGVRQDAVTKARMGRLVQLSKDPNYQQWNSLRHRIPQLTIPGLYIYGMDDVLSPVENA